MDLGVGIIERETFLSALALTQKLLRGLGLSEAEARRRGDPYLVYSDGHGHQRVLSLPEAWTRVTIGRGMAAV